MDVTTLLGKTLTKCEQIGNEEIRFETVDGERFALYHESDYCESVTIEDVNGDLADLVGSPITMAEATSSSSDGSDEWPVDVEKPKYTESWTWTFYRFATVKGYVTIRWLGESNGYYSESVDFAPIGENGRPDRWA